MSRGVRPEPLHHGEGARETLQHLRPHREVPGRPGRSLGSQQRFCLYLFRDDRRCVGGEEGDGWQGAGREADPGGLLHHKEASHPDSWTLHGPTLTRL